MDWTPDLIKALREHADMTQATMGAYLGYSQPQVRVSELEHGKRGVSGGVGRLLDMLAQRHGFDASEDLAGVKDPRS